MHFQIRLAVQSKPEGADARDYRDDYIVIRVQAPDETTAVGEVARAVSKLVACQALSGERVYEKL